ncbi:MAG: hypothetical protein QXL51_01075 [Candidatus Aenigmatarchaeota archaeon]
MENVEMKNVKKRKIRINKKTEKEMEEVMDALSRALTQLKI